MWEEERLGVGKAGMAGDTEEGMEKGRKMTGKDGKEERRG
jgi:hypothetical protein